MAPIKRRQTYEADDIIVTFDPDVCIHSGVCVRGLPDVFDIKHKRWARVGGCGGCSNHALPVRRPPVRQEA